MKTATAIPQIATGHTGHLPYVVTEASKSDLIESNRLRDLCSEYSVRLLQADGRNASHLTEGLLVTSPDNGARWVFIVPPGQSHSVTLAQLRTALAAKTATIRPLLDAPGAALAKFEAAFEQFTEHLGGPAKAAGRFLAALEQDQARAAAVPSGDSTCPDRIAWCTGDAATHADPREHIHHGPANAITDPAGQRVMEFSIVQWHDARPKLEFESGGQWDAFDLDQTDDLIAATVAHLDKLRKARNQLAELLAAIEASA